jgi:predicted amidohydrolase YtcJ
VLGPGERLAVRDALALYTTEAAFAMHRERDLGSLEQGKLADFVVVDRSPLRVEPGQITDIRVLQTVAGGQPAFHADDSPLAPGPWR